jgi:drug/metabolite transporter (DMT)-like permease
MYCLLFSAFGSLKAHEVVLFTLLTPFYVTLLGDWMEGRRLKGIYLLSAALAVSGAAVIKANPLETQQWWRGFAIMQGANFCFAFGQVAYRRFKLNHPSILDRQIYALLFMGGTVLAGAFTFTTEAFPVTIQANQFLVIFYLGLVASGLGFYWWNRGAALVSNTGLLAAFNNLSIPLGVLVSVTVFQESTNGVRLAIGSVLLVAALLISNPSNRLLNPGMPSKASATGKSNAP